MKLIVSDWKQAYKWLSVQASTIFATIALSWSLLTPEQQDALLQFIGLPPGTLVAIAFGTVIVGRLAAQSGLDKTE